MSAMALALGLSTSQRRVLPAGRHAVTSEDVTEVKWIGVKPKGPGRPSSRYFHSSCVVGGSIVVFGGYDTSRVHNDLYVLDYATNVWRILEINGKSPPRRAKNTSCWVDDKMLLLGGSNGRQEAASAAMDINVFDINLLEWVPWRSHGDVPFSTHSHSADFIGKLNAVVLFGGVQGSFGTTADVHVLYWDDKLWAQVDCKGLAPFERRGHCSCASSDKLFVYGGETQQFKKLADLHVLSFRTKTPTWTSVVVNGALPPAKLGASLSYAKGSLLLFGGSLRGETFSNGLYVFDKASNEWRSAHANQAAPLRIANSVVSIKGLPAPGRYGHTASYTTHGLIVIGGNKHLPLKVYYRLPV